MSEEYDDDLLAVAGLNRQTGNKKRIRRAAPVASEEFSAEEDGQEHQSQRPGRRTIGAAKKRRVSTSKAEQVKANMTAVLLLRSYITCTVLGSYGPRLAARRSCQILLVKMPGNLDPHTPVPSKPFEPTLSTRLPNACKGLPVQESDSEEYGDGYGSDLMGDDADRARLAAMTELDREMELLERGDKRAAEQEKRRLAKQHRTQQHADEKV